MNNDEMKQNSSQKDGDGSTTGDRFRVQAVYIDRLRVQMAPDGQSVVILVPLNKTIDGLCAAISDNVISVTAWVDKDFQSDVLRLPTPFMQKVEQPRDILRSLRQQILGPKKARW